VAAVGNIYELRPLSICRVMPVSRNLFVAAIISNSRPVIVYSLCKLNGALVKINQVIRYTPYTRLCVNGQNVHCDCAESRDL